MTYTIKYRDKSGSVKTMELDAPDRSAAFAELKKRGINAINVEGSHGRTNSSASRPTLQPSVLRGAAALVIVVIAAFVAFQFVSTGNSGSEAPSKAKREAKTTLEFEKPAKEVNASVVAEAQQRKPPETVDEAMANLDLPKTEIVKASKPVVLNPYTNRTFKTGTEQLISWVFTTELGDIPVPLPSISKDDRDNIVSILLSRSEIKESDSDRVKDAKTAVNTAKKEFLEYIRQGGDPDEFLDYYQKELRRAFEMRTIASEQAEELYQRDPELGRAYLDQVNEKFAADGIKQLVAEDYED